MSTPSDNDLGSVFNAAIQSVLGGLFVWLLTCSLAGAIATAATVEHIDDLSWLWAFAWAWHLAVAGMWLWGLLIICIHAFCLSALIHGTDRVLRVIVIVFTVQLTTSTIVIVTINKDTLPHAAAVWLPLATISTIYLIRSFVKQNNE
ncbi:MAG: hypothetical protein ACLP2Y_18120 [Limisphaerales bacterium]